MQHCGTLFNTGKHCDHFLFTNTQNPNRKGRKEFSKRRKESLALDARAETNKINIIGSVYVY
ncbi:MAG: hypothetical protein CVU04_02970 [Bacteroidetes bacterium HGW-Bacteroidetes-20]|nr:MAG: hypothetical protein CVU04_02970 [Bacteroidetes bacterium HGW-Bacteroidetes-20]